MHIESFAQIEPARFGIVDKLGRLSRHADLSLIDDVGAVGHGEGFANAVIGNENAEAPIAHRMDALLDLLNGLGIHSGERLVQKHETGLGGQGAGYLDAAALSARERISDLFVQMRNAELIEKEFQSGPLLGLAELHHLKHGQDVFLDGQLTKNRRLLGEITQANPRSLEQRKTCDLYSLQENASSQRLDNSHDHIEGRRFSGAVGTEQAHDFAAPQTYTHVADDVAASIGFVKTTSLQNGFWRVSFRHLEPLSEIRRSHA